MPPSSRPQPRLVIFDLDGVVYRGDEAIPGAASLVRGLRRDGRLVRFATNNSTATRDEYASRLERHGISATTDEIVTSSSATVEHLRHHLPGLRSVLALGADGLLSELRAARLRVTAAPDAAPDGWDGGELPERYDAVVTGLDPRVDYRRLGIAAAAIRDGARFVATNADVRFPTPDGFMPGAGAIVAALEAASGERALVVGKPEPAMFRSILERTGMAASEALVVGDNPDADVIAARRAGITSVLVLTGVADPALAPALEGERRPDHVAAGPGEVADLLGISFSR